MTLQRNRERGLIGQRQSLGDQMLSWLSGHRTLIAAFALRGVGIIAGLALTFLLARHLGAEATGTYALVSQTAIFLAAFGMLGLDLSLVRHLARSPTERRPIAVTTFLRVLATSIALLVAIAFILVLGGHLIWQALFGDALGRHLLLLLCTMMFARGMTNILAGFLRSQDRIAIGIILSLLAMPITAVAALVVGIATTVEQVLWAAAFGGTVAAVWGLWSSTNFLASSEITLRVPLGSILRSALPLWGASVAVAAAEWYSIAISARMLGLADAGVFRVGSQIAGLLTVVSGTINTVYMAKISGAFHANDGVRAARLARSAVRMSAVVAVPMAIAVLAAAPILIDRVGQEFEPVLLLVVILVGGQLAQTLTGPCGLVLAMSGNERINLGITVVSTILLVICVPLATHVSGLNGIAVCLSVLMLLRNISAYVIVRTRVGIGIWTGTFHARPEGMNT